MSLTRVEGVLKEDVWLPIATHMGSELIGAGELFGELRKIPLINFPGKTLQMG